jgi:FkbM family methyltransferase
MTDSSIGRYTNLILRIRNWFTYFVHKNSSGFKPARFVTRGKKLVFDVPTRELYLVFKEIFLTDFYSIKTWIDKLPANPVVVDVGANAGYFSTLLLSKRPDSKVFAYEAIQHNVDLFRNNIGLNPAIRESVQLNHRAVTGQPVEFIVLYKEADSENSVTASVFEDFESHNLKSISVRAISLQKILEENRLEQIDFLKLDCEGSEYPIIYDSPRSLWDKVNTIFMEAHNLDNDKRNFAAMNEFLLGLGYQTSHKLATNGCYAVHASRK